MSEDPPDTDDADVTFEEAADLLTERATFDGTAKVGDQMIPIRVREPTLGGLEEIEAELPEDAEEVDAARELIGEYLLQPKVAAKDLGITRAMALFLGMRRTWQQTDAFDDVRDELDLDEGNR